ncbi:MAG: hypothetical protein AABX39_01370 [Nanoarchaeota archaeon]
MSTNNIKIEDVKKDFRKEYDSKISALEYHLGVGSSFSECKCNLVAFIFCTKEDQQLAKDSKELSHKIENEILPKIYQGFDVKIAYRGFVIPA